MQISIMTLNLRTEQYFCSLLFPRSLIIMLSVNSFNKLNLLFFKCQQAKHRQQPSNLHVSVTLFLHFCGWILFRITLSFSHLNQPQPKRKLQLLNVKISKRPKLNTAATAPTCFTATFCAYRNTDLPPYSQTHQLQQMREASSQHRHRTQAVVIRCIEPDCQHGPTCSMVCDMQNMLSFRKSMISLQSAHNGPHLGVTNQHNMDKYILTLTLATSGFRNMLNTSQHICLMETLKRTLDRKQTCAKVTQKLTFINQILHKDSKTNPISTPAKIKHKTDQRSTLAEQKKSM